ncbi:MAG TPA: hypothetical protein EYG57_09305 [Planctomycetes bacterium]|uniref:hypothetical protein n=1 Tax=Henriciella sp. TaxID=1968823 RepID=UPI0017A39BEC|nr:hypothetical protein [Henriciella sp.]HIG21760.1 hypothetical protein [Henriciella sp.]HIM29743.1 hypothetical protein [Planctomycetota bacterium]
MHVVFDEVPERILGVAKGVLAQANMHAVFADPGNEHWDFICIANAAHAGELFIKAIVAQQHPLLIFRDPFGLDAGADEMTIEDLIARGRTHDFEKLPKVLWAATGERIADLELFHRVRAARNSVQHFCALPHEDYRALSLEFIYKIIDPLIFKFFGLFAIDYHEDHNIGYDYIVGSLIRRELRFSVPADFSVGEIDLVDELSLTSTAYQEWWRSALSTLESHS